MKKFFLIVLLSFFLVSCSGSERNAYCPSDETEYLINELTLLNDAFIDGDNVAGVTGRGYLTAPVLAMQAVKQEVNALEVPPCLDESQANLISGMDHTINGYIAFMGEEDNDVIAEEFASGDAYFLLFYAEISDLLDCLPNCVEE